MRALHAGRRCFARRSHASAPGAERRPVVPRGGAITALPKPRDAMRPPAA
jgi:hypothetical protein